VAHPSPVSDYFAADGLLARTLSGFAPRESQRLMAEAVSATISGAGQLMVEAGTGTGKTFAYLVPALASGKRVIISTGSKALQEQLYNRDLPTLLAAMEYAQPVALLKGRANYLCLHRLDQLLTTSHLQEAEVLADLVRVKTFSIDAVSGDVAEIPGLLEQAPILPHVTSTNDNCLGRECPRYDDCYLVRARRKAMDAQLLVINHHLFFADMVVKDTGFAELIPDADVYIFDEAHQLPDIASGYFGESLSSRQLLDVAQEMVLAQRAEAGDMVQLSRAAEALELACREQRLAFGIEPSRGNVRDWVGNPLFDRTLQRLKDTLRLCYEVLKLALGRGERLDHCFERLVEYQGKLERLLQTEQPGAAYWFDTTRIHFSFNLTPLSIAERFNSEVMRAGCSWVFTSATLTVGHEFSHFSQQLGIGQARQLVLESPFAFAQQSLLCVPRGLPDTGFARRATELAQLLTPVINKVPGGVFFLCTSYQSMRQIVEVLRRDVGRLVLLQGEDNKQRLLHQFVENGRAILVATASFWEGVDVRGAALSCVIIDKLPFTAPDEPLLKARMEDCRLQGGDPFNQLQLPDAVITLKQGVGRLIRDMQDRGVLVLCDPRIVNRPYGATFLQSLPPMPRCRDLAMINRFWQQEPPASQLVMDSEPAASERESKQ
jgi:ATP-dependent DNA helicase DinG